MNFTWLNKPLMDFFIFVHNTFIKGIGITNPEVSYGLAIILFTAIIRVILLPLNIKQTRSQVAMTEIQPEVKKLQEKYKNDPQKQQQEMMKLYKEKGVNPMGGCLPLLVQLPILWALFYVFRSIPEFRKYGFLWIKVLSKPDSAFVIRILPILSGVTQYISTVLMSPSGNSDQAKQTTTMNITMSIFMVFMSWNFNAALVLYWVTNNLFQIGQTLVMKNNDRKRKASAD